VIITTGQPRSSASDDNFTPLVFEKSMLKVYIKKRIKKKCRVFAWLHDATIFYQEETLLFTGKMY
jgi:hypothetical protein